jgi:GTP-binding protein HflX
VYADVLMIVVDASDPEYRVQLETTEQLLEELGASEKPTLYVFNKCDKGASLAFRSIGTYAQNHRTVTVSAQTGQGIEEMLSQLQELLGAGKKRVVFHIPNASAGMLNILYQDSTVENVDYGAEEMVVTAVVDAKTHGRLARFDPLWEAPDEE